MPWLTGDSLPVGAVCRTIRIPDALWCLEAVDGALLSLAELFNWETFGVVTAREAADRFQAVFLDYIGSRCMPIGGIIAFAGSVAPEHTLFCDGASYSTDDYPALFAVIGYTFGGSGAVFSVPDMRARVPVGAGAGSGGLSTYTVGQTFGEEAHELVVGELASHSHTTIPHSHTEGTATLSAAVVVPADGPSAVPSTGITGSAGVTVDNTGDGTAHENRQPSIALNWLIGCD